MGSILNQNDRLRVAPDRAGHRARLVAALLLILALVAAGCGSGAKKSTAGEEEMGAATEKSEAGPSSQSGKSAGKSGAKAENRTASSAPKTVSKAAESAPAGGTIVLTDRGCVEFEPHWATIRVGQSLTWRSELKKPVTIHVPAGTFDRSEFVVPARGTVRSGPARESGDHSVWTLPGACQAAPHGVQGAGPGISIEPGA